VNSLKTTKNKEILETKVQAPKVDPAEWRLEVERVAPLLKIKLNNENKDWRLHLQQMRHYQHKIDSTKNQTQTQLTRLQKDIEGTLETITSREKYINAQFESKVKPFNIVRAIQAHPRTKF
jgi:estrogen-related receptor beta like 1